MRFLSLFRYVALVVAVILTLRVQALWLTDDVFEMFLPVVLWVGLFIDWAVRQWKANRRFERGASLLPVCLFILVVSGATHAPLRVMFWTHRNELLEEQKQLLAWVQKGALTQSGKHSEKKEFDGSLIDSSVRYPFQIAQSRGDTRFFLWESHPDFSVKTALGFAYCPGDNGCGRASFWDYWDYSGDSPEHIDPPAEYYWDYSHGEAEYVSLGGNWYATKVSVEDVGD